MTRQVALSEEAYARLRRAKRPGESFSRAVLRLLAGEKDPNVFLRRKHALVVPVAELLIESDEGREGDDPYAGG